MSVIGWLVLLTLIGAPAAGLLIAAAHGLGWLVGRVEEQRRMPAPYVHELDD